MYKYPHFKPRLDLKQGKSPSSWNLSAKEKKDVKGVMEHFDNYSNLRKNIPFQWYILSSRQQEPGESFDH